LKLVGRVSRAELEAGGFVRLPYPPFDVLVAWRDGAPCAMEDACNHAGASLAEGWRTEDGRCVVCPMHSYEFDLVTGECVSPRGLCDAQRTFVTRIEGDDVVVYDPVQITLIR
jgi:nitrite reductase/ring-hydroxylating ferredoxin subunit